MKKIYSLSKILVLFLCLGVITFENASAQTGCDIALNSNVTAPNAVCGPPANPVGSVSGGAGEYWQLGVLTGIYYSFYWANSGGCPNFDGFCVSGTGGAPNIQETNTSTLPLVVQATSNTTWDISFYRSTTTWCGSSAILYYEVTVPTATATGATTANVCASTGSYSPAGYTAANGSILWTSSGNGSFTGGTTETPTYNFGTQDISTGGLVTLTMTVTNGSCSSAATFTLNISTLPTTATINGYSGMSPPAENAPCGSLTSATGGLGGNATPDVGTWSQLLGPGTTTFNGGVHDPTTTATVTRSGVYEYAWSITNGACPASNAYVKVDYIGNPSGGSIDHANFCSTSNFGTLSVTGVTNATSYIWSLPSGLSGVSNSSTITVGGNIPGLYTVTVTPVDSGLNGATCVTGSLTGTVHILSVPVIDSIHTGSLPCYGVSNDTITVFANTNNGNVHYSLNGGTTYPNITGIFPGEAPGSYDVFVKDDSGCTANNVVNPLVISQPSAPLRLSASVDQITCHDYDNGSILLLPSGGWGAYTYHWANGDTIQLISDLPANTYTASVTDAKGCTVSVQETITDPAALSDVITSGAVTCGGSGNGSASVTSVAGGVPPYTYLWSNFAASSSIGSLGGGTYYVIITDSNGCEKRDSAIITVIKPLSARDSTAQTSCAGTDNSSIFILPSGGTSPYTYVWSPAGSTTADTTNVASGTYSVTVTDQSNCTATVSVAVSNSPAISISDAFTEPTCNGLNNGSISLLVTGGVAPYTYHWNIGGSIGPDVLNAFGGTQYNVTVTDASALHCPAVDSVYLGQPAILTVSGIQRNESCYGYNDGSLQGLVYGGTPPYTYQWYLGRDTTIAGRDTSLAPQGPSTENIDQLAPGTYSLVIADANGCQAPFQRQILGPDSLEISLVKTDVTCQDLNSGSVAVVVSGGTLPYQYLWTNFVTDSFQNNIPGGEYGVVVIDSNGCHQTDTTVVNGQVSPITVVNSLSNPSCSNSTNGFVALDVSGGAPPYTYIWSTAPAQTGSVATDLAGGSYYVTISDDKGCHLLDTATIVAPTPVAASIGSTSTSCFSSASGQAIVNVTGGVPPYTYQLGNVVQHSDTFTNLNVGDYTLIVTDANGCLGSAGLTISSTGSLSVVMSATPDVVLVRQPVQLEAIAQSDTTIIAYIWSPVDSLDFTACTDSADCNNPIATPAIAQYYRVTVEDAYGCTVTDSILVTISNTLSQFIPTAFTPNGDGLNDEFEFNVLGVTTASVQIWNRWGQLMYSNPAQPNGTGGTYGWDGTYNGSPVPYDTYTYQFVLTYFDGHQQVVSGTVVVLR